MTLPAGLTPRCLTRAEAAEYCRLEGESFDKWVQRGLIPGPIPGTRRYDRKAIDLAIDKLSNLPADAISSADADLRDWLGGRNANAA